MGHKGTKTLSRTKCFVILGDFVARKCGVEMLGHKGSKTLSRTKSFVILGDLESSWQERERIPNEL